MLGISARGARHRNKGLVDPSIGNVVSRVTQRTRPFGSGIRLALWLLNAVERLEDGEWGTAGNLVR